MCEKRKHARALINGYYAALLQQDAVFAHHDHGIPRPCKMTNAFSPWFVDSVRHANKPLATLGRALY
jgi:hypothetical protein